MRTSVLVGAAAQDAHEALLIRSAPSFSAPAGNILVAGLPFEFRELGARAMIAVDGRALWLSPAALDMIASSDTIALVDGKLAGRTRHSEQLLRGMIAEVLQRSEMVDLLVAPASTEAPELFLQAQNRSGGASAVIAITFRALGRDMDRLPDLTKLFGLTPTEHKIVRLLMQGHSVRGIAAQLGTSVLTVRTHLKRTYAKVNVGTKEQLFSTLLKLMID
jgi:DNA-binding CsgD family transcriptional regulator